MWRLAFIVLVFSHALPAHAEKLTISTELYPPYNFVGTDGEPTGVYMDQLQIIFRRANISHDAVILPWARAKALAETRPRHCVVAAARTYDREKLFKWVSPIHIDRNILVARRDANLSITHLDAARKYVIGTQRNDYTHAILTSLGFPRIDLSPDFNTTLARLSAGRIDMMPMSESALKNLSSNDFEEVILLANQGLGMACHKTVPDRLITKMQRILDEMIADGTQRQIFEKYGLVVPN